jgi:uncharacterized protein YndB with AHSA1/START domain
LGHASSRDVPEPIPLDLEEGFMTRSQAEGRTDSATKLILASPEQLYAAFANGETLMQWLPPPAMTGRALEYQFREGGTYRIELRYRDGGHGAGKTTGDSDTSTGRFVQLVPNRRIRETVEFETDDEALAHGMTMTWTFEPRREATEVMVTAENVPEAIGREDHLEGLVASLDNLARFVARTG